MSRISCDGKVRPPRWAVVPAWIQAISLPGPNFFTTSFFLKASCRLCVCAVRGGEGGIRGYDRQRFMRTRARRTSRQAWQINSPRPFFVCLAPFLSLSLWPDVAVRKFPGRAKPRRSSACGIFPCQSHQYGILLSRATRPRSIA